MTLNKKIELAEKIYELTTTHNIWRGMSPFPFILYDDKNQVAAGNDWPEQFIHMKDNIWVAEGVDPFLLGNTATTYHDKLIAIWDTRTWDVSIDSAHAASCIAHEMFHCYQQQAMHLEWADELLFPQYPHTPRSIALVMEESSALLKMLTNPGDGLAKLIAIRSMRKAEIPAEFLKFDQQVETTEGTATYVEMQLLSTLQNKPMQETLATELPKFLSNDNLLQNYRQRLYAVGAIMCFAADALYPHWQQEWEKSGLTIFDWLQERHQPSAGLAEIPAQTLQNAALQLDTFEQKKVQQISEFISQPLTAIEGDVQIVSFDPMNIVCANGQCLHKHAQVRIDGVTQMLDHPFLVEYGETIFDVKRLHMPSMYK